MKCYTQRLYWRLEGKYQAETLLSSCVFWIKKTLYSLRGPVLYLPLLQAEMVSKITELQNELRTETLKYWFCSWVNRLIFSLSWCEQTLKWASGYIPTLNLGWAFLTKRFLTLIWKHHEKLTFSLQFPPLNLNKLCCTFNIQEVS